MSTAAGVSKVVERCTWCGSRLAAHMRVIIAGGRFSGSSSQLDTLRGHVVRVRPSHTARTVKAIVPLRNTPAHSAGYDLLFVLCSIACRDALDSAIRDEAMIVKIADQDRQPAVTRRKAAKGRSATGRLPPELLRRRPS